MSAQSGKKCVAAQADVRKPEQLKAAVEKAISEFGHIDFVICGACIFSCLSFLLLVHSFHVSWIYTDFMCTFFSNYIGAAGNFLAPISGLSENAFRTVVEIDTVRGIPSLLPQITAVVLSYWLYFHRLSGLAWNV